MKFNRIRDPQPQAIVPQVDGSWFSMSSYGGGMIKPTPFLRPTTNHQYSDDDDDDFN